MRGARRRLTLVPGALSPEPASASGSRFSTLCTEDLVDRDVEALAVKVAADVLAEDRLVSRDDVCRPAISESDLARGFWAYVDSPSTANRFWEFGSPSDGGEVQGTSVSFCCRSSEEKVERRRACSSSPLAERPRPAPVVRPRSGGCGQGRALRLPAVRVGWHGPLPRPRITPPACLGEFFPEELVEAMDAADRSLAGSSSIGAVAGAEIADHVDHVIVAVHGRGPGHVAVRPWAHLGRRFKGLRSNLDPCPRQSASSSIDHRLLSPIAIRTSSAGASSSDSVSSSAVCFPGPASSAVIGSGRSFAEVVRAPVAAMAGQQPQRGGGEAAAGGYHSHGCWG